MQALSKIAVIAHL